MSRQRPVAKWILANLLKSEAEQWNIDELMILLSKYSKTLNDIRDPEFFIDKGSSEYESTENKKCPPNNFI